MSYPGRGPPPQSFSGYGTPRAPPPPGAPASVQAQVRVPPHPPGQPQNFSGQQSLPARGYSMPSQPPPQQQIGSMLARPPAPGRGMNGTMAGPTASFAPGPPRPGPGPLGPPSGMAGARGPPPVSSMGAPPSSGAAPRPGPAPASVQFYSVAGGAPTPVAPVAPPTMPPPPTGMQQGSHPPHQGPGRGAPSGLVGGDGAPPTAQMQRMNLGAAPSMAVSQQPAYAGQQPSQVGYSAAPMPPGAYGAATAAGATGGGFQSLDSQLPSLAEMDLSIQSDKRFMQLSVGQIPNSANAHAQGKVPLGAVIQPMALDMDQQDGGIPLVNFGPQGIMRCKRCRTYINPFVSWMNNGRQWRCNVCGMVNDVPTSYFCHLDSNGFRRDRDQRPELCNGSVELVAPAEYMVRPPVAPVYFFCIDISSNAVNSGMVLTAVKTIKSCLDELPGGDRTQIGFITFDNSVHFYNLKSTLSQPQMLVVSDLSDLLLPCPDDLLVNLSESRSVVDTLLDNLPTMVARTKAVDSALGPALNAAGQVMSHLGGKLVVFCANLPSIGDGKLKLRENPRLLGTDKEYLLLNPEEKWYQDKAIELSKYQICAELFLFSGQYQDVATLSQLPNKTAGNLFYYAGFNATKDGEKLEAELRRVLVRPTAFEAVMRIRCTRGLRITNFLGNYFIRANDLLALPNCTPDSVFGVEIGFDEQVLTANVISMQAALLYTTTGGERRIRVHNVAVPVQTVLTEVFNSVNIDVVCNLLAKQALDVALRTGLHAARARLQQVCVDVLRASRGGGYGSYGGGPQQSQQGANIPVAVQLLPLYCMALMKNLAFRGGADIRTDERAFILALLANMPVDHSRCFIYPRMFSLHDMPEDAGLELSSASETTPTAGKRNVKLPPVANLSAERLSSNGIFLMENSILLQIWVGRSASPQLVQSLFGVPSLEGLDTNTVKLQQAASGVGKRVLNIVAALREERSPWLQVQVIGEGDGQNEHRFFWHLVEDRSNFPGGGMSYAEFMQQVNRQSFGAIG